MKKSKPTFQVTERDFQILEGLLDYGVLSLKQIQALYFLHSAATTRAKRDAGITAKKDVISTVWLRLGILSKLGIITLSDRAQTAQLHGMRTAWVSRKGAALIAERQGMLLSDLPWHKPAARWTQVIHDLWANELRIQAELTVQQSPEFTVKEWISGRILASDFDEISYQVSIGGKQLTKKRRILPDGFLILEQQGFEGKPSRFPVEIDNSTHPQTRLIREKLCAGLAYLSSPQYKKRFGDNAGRWLFLMESERRMKHLQAALVRELGKGSAAFYFTTFARMAANNVLLSPIWFHGGSETPQSLADSIKTGA